MSVPGIGIGRIVHYRGFAEESGDDGLCLAAIIVFDHATSQGHVDLAVFPNDVLTTERKETRIYAEDKRGGSWHWPERVESES